jgi:hypothetical protein
MSWSAPYENGSIITSYQVLLRHVDGVSFTEDLTNCDGSDAIIFASLSCTIPLATLTAEPYSLTYGTSV